MEVGIERHARSRLLSRVFENLRIVRATQPDLTDMDDIPASRGEHFGRGPGQALVQQETSQAGSNGMILS